MNKHGFKVESLIIVGLVSLFVALAVPNFSEYRKLQFNASTVETLEHLANAEEAYYALNEEYLTCNDEDCIRNSDGSSGLPGINSLPKDIRISINADGEFFTAKAYSVNGTREYYWDSATGGLQDSKELTE